MTQPAFDPDKLAEAFGNVPGEMIDAGAKMLKPVENYVWHYVNLWDNIDDPSRVEAWHAMNTWVRDIIPMSGAAYRQLINEFYKENRLIEGDAHDPRRAGRSGAHAGEPAQRDRRGRPHHAALPVGVGDVELVGSTDKEVFRVKGGHIGIMAGRGAKRPGRTSTTGSRRAPTERPVARTFNRPRLGRTYCMCWPPLMEMFAPVMKAASLEQR